LNFGCVPVVLSDDLVWALSDQTGGPLNHSSFSFQIPQSIVHYTAARSLRVYRDRKRDFGVLPSGRLIYDLLEQSVAAGEEFENGIFVNPLVQILRRVSQEDYEYLYRSGIASGEKYRYYRLNKTMTDIPTAFHVRPDGGAIEVLSDELTKRKTYGLQQIYSECVLESQRKHAYVPRYTCDGKDTVDSLLPIKEKPKPRPKGGNKRM